MSAVIGRLKSVKSSPSVVAVPVVVQTPTDPEVSQIIDEIDKENSPKTVPFRRGAMSVGKAMHKLGGMTRKSLRVSKSSVGTDPPVHDPSSHHSIASSRHGPTDEELAADKAQVKSGVLARAPSGPLRPTPQRSQELFELDPDVPETEIQEAVSKAQPRMRLFQSKVHDDPVGLLPPSPKEVESVAETLSKSMRHSSIASSASTHKDSNSALDSMAGQNPKGLGLIMRKVQHNKIVMAAVSRFSQLAGGHAEHPDVIGSVDIPSPSFKPSEEELLKRGVRAFIQAGEDHRVRNEEVVGEIHFSGHSARVARERQVRFEVQDPEPEPLTQSQSAPSTSLLAA
eukprot:jgi/Botrbrau1/7360/Bobra.0316s0008.1